MKKVLLVLIALCLSATLAFAADSPKVLLNVNYGINFATINKGEVKIEETSIPLNVSVNYFVKDNQSAAIYAELGVNFGLDETINGVKKKLNFAPSGQDIILGGSYFLNLNKGFSIISTLGFEFLFNSNTINTVVGSSKTLNVSFGLAYNLLANIRIQDTFCLGIGLYSAIFYADYSRTTVTSIIDKKTEEVSKGFSKGYLDYDVAPTLSFGFMF